VAQKPYIPTEQDRTLIRLLCAGGILQARIAVAIGISESTLRRHYRRDIKVGATEIDGLAVGTLVKAMRGGGKEGERAAEFWLERRVDGWRQPPTRIAGADGGPVVATYVVRAPTAVESAAEWLSTYAPSDNS
jgi:DNA-binding CsgD family transcriptional regulator